MNTSVRFPNSFVKYIRESVGKRKVWRAVVKLRDEMEGNRLVGGTVLYCSENYRTKKQASVDVRENYLYKTVIA